MWKIRKKDNIRLTGLKRFFKNNLNKSLNLKCVYSWDPNHLSLEAEILSRRHFSETCWPRVVSTELALGKLFHEKGFNFGTVGRTTLAQVAKRPWEQGLRARPFRWSLFLLVSLSGFVITSVCIFIGFGQKSYFNLRPIFLAETAPAWVEDPFNGF